jgi:hypothetical protein
MVHPVVKKIAATRPQKNSLQKPPQPFPGNILLHDFNSITGTSS